MEGEGEGVELVHGDELLPPPATVAVVEVAEELPLEYEYEAGLPLPEEHTLELGLLACEEQLLRLGLMVA